MVSMQHMNKFDNHPSNGTFISGSASSWPKFHQLYSLYVCYYKLGYIALYRMQTATFW